MRRLGELEVSCGGGNEVGVHDVCPGAEAAVVLNPHPALRAGLSQREREPLADWDGEAGLGTGENSVGQRPERRMEHRSFIRRVPVSDPFFSGAEQLDIDERHANFEGVSHSRPVRIAKKLITHVPAGFQTRQPGTWRTDWSDIGDNGSKSL